MDGVHIIMNSNTFTTKIAEVNLVSSQINLSCSPTEVIARMKLNFYVIHILATKQKTISSPLLKSAKKGL